MAREIPELCKPGKEVFREGWTITGGAIVPAIAVRLALSSVVIADPEGLPAVLRSREASEEERTEHEAKHDRGSSWVFGSPQFGPRRARVLGCAPDDAGERALTICGFLCQSGLPLLGFEPYEKEAPDRYDYCPFARISTYPPGSDQTSDRSQAISPLVTLERKPRAISSPAPRAGWSR
jgi:hypothetical protein